MIGQAGQAIKDCEFATMLVHRLVDGLENEATMIHPPGESGCLNWFAGYSAASRSHELDAARAAHAWQADVRRPYSTDAEHIKADGEAIHVDRLLEELDRSGELLRAARLEIREDHVLQQSTGYRHDKMREVPLQGLHCQEAYYLSQLELLAGVAIS